MAPKTKRFEIENFLKEIFGETIDRRGRVPLIKKILLDGTERVKKISGKAEEKNYEDKKNVCLAPKGSIYVFEFDIGEVRKFNLIIGGDSVNNRYTRPVFKQQTEEAYKKAIECCKKYNVDVTTDAVKQIKVFESKNYTIKIFKQMLLIRCLHDYLLETNSQDARRYFNFTLIQEGNESCLKDFNNAKITDCDLLRIVFYDKSIIESTRREDVIKRRLGSNSIKIHGDNNEEREIDDNFVEQLLCHPLFYYLLNRENSSEDDFSEPELIRFLINECVILNNGKLLFLPFSEALIARERKICFTKLATQSSVDPSLFFDRISKLAYSVSKGKGEISFGAEKIEDFCKSKTGTVVSDFFNFLTTFLDKDGEKYKFKSKITRLFFCAHYLAKNFNAYTFFDDLIDCCLVVKKTDGQTQTDPLVDIDKDGFDTLIILSGLVLNMIPETDKNCFLSYLAEKPARNYEVKSRKEQIAAIAIISYTALFEWSLLKKDERKKMFEAAFGQTEYSFQIKVAENLIQNDFYKNEIEECLKKLGTDDQVQPVYFYYYHHFPESFKIFSGRDDTMMALDTNVFFDIFKPFEFRRYTHNVMLDENNFIEFVKDIFFEQCNVGSNRTYKAEFIINQLKKIEQNGRIEIDKKCVFLLYSCQALLISIANYERKKSRIFSNDENGKNAEGRLLKLAIYCDYFTRKINPSYCDPSKFKSGDFLLCGPFRIFCLRKFEVELQIRLLGDMKTDYKNWLEVESGRYKILLLRLLAYTDFNVNSIGLPAVTQDDFLEYDNIDAFKIQQDKRAKEENRDYIFGPLKWYKND